ncbi:hypothetical protein HZS_5939 [Henneguya salminicola]|nr:hypothetical protein HZS_5939 [Henneguya salminicola]
MVLIPVKFGSNKEWYIIELQGHVEMEESEFKGLFGTLYFTTDKTPYLLLGHSKLKGEISKFKNPLIFLTKVEEKDKQNSLKVCAVARHKITFIKRPIPIV